MLRHPAAVAFLAGAALVSALGIAFAQAPEPAPAVPKFDCTAVNIPITRMNTGVDVAMTVQLPPGYHPVGGTSASPVTTAGAGQSVRAFVVACKER